MGACRWRIVKQAKWTAMIAAIIGAFGNY